MRPARRAAAASRAGACCQPRLHRAGRRYASAVDVSASLPGTLGDVLAAARSGYDELLAVAEEIEDEWSETNDLASAWAARFDEVEAARGNEPASPRIGAAVAALVEEARAIDDPHRAIDWLSTFPQVLLIALGEPL
jgi:hypothetical protein